MPVSVPASAPRVGLCLALALLLAPGSAGLAQEPEFEGMIRIRLLSVDVDHAESLEKVSVSSLLNLPTGYLLQLKKSDGSPAANSSLQTYYVKEGVIRVETDDTDDEGVYILVDLRRAVITTVSPDEEEYTEVTIADLAAPLIPLLRSSGYQVRPLNRTEKINGIEATGYEAKAGDNVVRAWVTKAYPELTQYFARLVETIPAGQNSEAAQILALAGTGTPVLVQMIDMDGRKVDHYEVQELLSVRRQPVDPRLLIVPEGFERKSPR